MSEDAAREALVQLVAARLKLEAALRLLDPQQHLRPTAPRRLLSSDLEIVTLPARVH